MNDKKLHLLAGVIIAVAVGLPPYLESLNLFAGLWSAITSGIIAASMKEYSMQLTTRVTHTIYHSKNMLANIATLFNIYIKK